MSDPDESTRLTYHGDLSYDPERWDVDEKPDDCQVCGTDLLGVGDRATIGQYCPECGVHVWIK